jgi:beta-galactosidase
MKDIFCCLPFFDIIRLNQFITKRILPVFIIFVLTCLSSAKAQQGSSIIDTQANQTVRERLLMDFGWRFALGHAWDTDKDFNHGTSYFSFYTKTGFGDGPAAPDFDDRSWRILDVPHDWAVELPFDSTGGHSHGYKAIGRNFPGSSIGWYRKSFFIPESDLGRRIRIQFDGVHRNSRVFVNGFYLGEEHSGYYPFEYDISDYLNYGGDNVVAVRADATMEEGWFYEGAGIYRHVWLLKTGPLHIPSYGTFVTSEIKGDSALVSVRTTIVNESPVSTAFGLSQSVYNSEGKQLDNKFIDNLSLAPSEEQEYAVVFSISGPRLWSAETPYLYKLATSVLVNGKTADSIETNFGIRTIRFDPGEGFFLNGKHVKLKGTNNHQDHAGVGTAIPDALQYYRIARLKEMGSNAYRCSHNPPTPELLDACDRLGMLVIDENRLIGSNREHLEKLETLIKRDRNHPSVIAWSLGNEEWAIEGNPKGARIAFTMQALAKSLDTTRAITVASSGGWGQGVSTVIDVMGFNYIFNGDIDRHHQEFPDQPGIGTEESTSNSTRGIYYGNRAKAHMAQSDRSPSGRSMETGFKFYAERPWLSGLFFWTGFDYKGEPNPFGWPQVGTQFGIIDQCGFHKDIFYYLESWWTDETVLHILPHWNWQDKGEHEISVWVYSNCDEAELFLNNTSMGRKAMPVYGHLEWTVDYEPGLLMAHGYKDGEQIVTEKMETTGEASAVKLIPRSRTIKADGEDVSVITVQVTDNKGRNVPDAGNEITFMLDGPGKIIGVGNGDPSSHEPDRYIDKVDRIKIGNLKKSAVDTVANREEITFEYDDSEWPGAFETEGFESHITEDTAKIIAIRGSFYLNEIREDAKITLFAKSLCQEQSVYINGYLVAENVLREQPGQTYVLDHSILRNGRNVYAVTGPSLVKRNQWEYLNTDPGIIQVITPSKPWKRKLFNGLAQVIVQSEKKPGEIKLRAKSPGLESAEVIIRTEPVQLRPALPAVY